MERVLTTLGLNWPSFIWHTVNFLILLFLLWKVLYAPVTRMLDQRATRVRESLDRADEVRRQAEEAEAARLALLTETRREAELIRNRADEQAKRTIGEAQARAQDEADRILASARAELQVSREQLMSEVRSYMADLVISATERVTRNALDGQAQRKLVEQFLASGAGAGPGPRR